MPRLHRDTDCCRSFGGQGDHTVSASGERPVTSPLQRCGTSLVWPASSTDLTYPFGKPFDIDQRSTHRQQFPEPRLLLLDGAEALARLRGNQGIDRHLFQQVIGSLLDSAGPWPTRVQGELVALLAKDRLRRDAERCLGDHQLEFAEFMENGAECLHQVAFDGTTLGQQSVARTTGI